MFACHCSSNDAERKPRSWPAELFVDAEGRIRHVQIGEGDYEQSERIIQQLLAEARSKSNP